MTWIVLLLALASVPAHAQARSQGWEEYCLRTHDCDAGEPEPFSGSPAALQRVNDEVNARYRYASDPFAYWADISELGSGDCKDFALAKRARLVRLGWPRANLPIALTWYGGVAHAVLLAWTNNRWYVLDQIVSAVVPIEQSPYRLWYIEPPHGRVWAGLPVGPPVARAAPPAPSRPPDAHTDRLGRLAAGAGTVR
jgi:predicted transglutaminase-like cysteine proteinase